MSVIRKFITLILIAFFLIVLIYSVAGVVWTYFMAPSEFGNTMKDAWQSLVSVGGGMVWLLILTVGWSIGWLIYSFYRRKNKFSQDIVSFHTFTALTFFLALVSATEISNVKANLYQVIAVIVQSTFYALIGFALLMRKRLAVYIFAFLFIAEIIFYTTILRPNFFPQITFGLLFVGTVAWFLLFKRHWSKLH